LLASSRPGWRLLAVCAVVATLPDADFFLPMQHRGPSHSVGAAAAAGVIAFLGLRLAGMHDPSRLAVVMAAAYGTHVLFDWLGADSSAPRGLMALWPFSSDFYISNLNVFHSVDRRYWLDGFWKRNTIAGLRELVILVPLVVAAWFARTRRPRR
jgi:inner membrane protein